jgi:type III pantothenate kinase
MIDKNEDPENGERHIPGVLAADVGNSALHLAAVTGDQVSAVQVVRPGDGGRLGEALCQLWAALPAPREFVAASVNAAHLALLEQAARQAIGQDVLVVGRDLPLPIGTDLPDPSAIGMDRLCCAAAAFDRLGVACVVADFGTAITIDCVSDEGVFLGGAILPGLGMGAAALHEHTDQLPLVELEEPTWIFGKDTRQAMVGGLVLGARGALRDLVERYANHLNHWPTVIITGGDAHLICPDPRQDDLVQAVVPDLALRGVAAAYYHTLIK